MLTLWTRYVPSLRSNCPPRFCSSWARSKLASNRRLPPDCIRWVKSDSVHLTLKFLGQVPSDQIELITLSLKNALAAQHAFTLEVAGVGCFPDLHRPRVIWVGVKEEAAGHQLQHVQRVVENAISPLGYPTEARDFSPHLTLGRLARDVRTPDLKKVGDVIGASQSAHWAAGMCRMLP